MGRGGMMHSRNERRAWYGGVEGDTGFKVGSGNKVWKDKWGGDVSLRDSFPEFYSIATSIDV